MLLSVYVFLCGLALTVATAMVFGFWEALAAGIVSMVASIAVFRFVDVYVIRGFRDGSGNASGSLHSDDS
jgi:hypothetical protein